MIEPLLKIGPPGTGKTTHMLSIVDKALADGIRPEHIACLTFTKKAATELIDRACVKFNLDKGKFPFIRTMHSLAFSIRELKKDMVVTKEHLDRFSEKMGGGYPFNHQYNPNTERIKPGGATGDICYRLHTKAKAMRRPIRDVWQDEPGVRVTWQEQDRFSRNFERMKQELGLMDYSDFLDQEWEPLDVRLFIVDEAQDLTRQQWEVIYQWAANAEQVVIAGDDDQAIFEWAGADLETFQSFQKRTETLPVSYRLPRAVYNVANRISGKIKSRLPKQWSPRDAEGEVVWVTNETYVDLSGPKTFLLIARHDYLLKKYKRLANQQGYAYINEYGRWSTNEDYIKAILHYEAMRNGREVTETQARNVCEFCTDAKLTDDCPSLVRYQDIKWPFTGEAPAWMKALDRLSEQQREYVRGLLQNGESLTKEPRIRIDTIHSVKGAEADVVVMFLEVAQTVSKAIAMRPDEELRVWYVGATRAREKLVIIPGGKFSVRNFFV